jgi:hypothetical protein
MMEDIPMFEPKHHEHHCRHHHEQHEVAIYKDEVAPGVGAGLAPRAVYGVNPDVLNARHGDSITFIAVGGNFKVYPPDIFTISVVEGGFFRVRQDASLCLMVRDDVEYGVYHYNYQNDTEEKSKTTVIDPTIIIHNGNASSRL